MSLMTLCRKDKAKMLYENNLTKGLVDDTGRFKILWALKLTFLPDLNSEKIKNHPVILPRTPRTGIHSSSSRCSAIVWVQCSLSGSQPSPETLNFEVTHWYTLKKKSA